MAEAIIAEMALFAWGRRLIERLGPRGTDRVRGDRIGAPLGATACAPPLAVLAAIQLLHAASFAMQQSGGEDRR